MTAPLSAAALPRLGEVIRDVERYAMQALAVMDREVDEASLPQDRDLRARVDIFRTSIGFHLEAIGRDLANLAALPLPRAGSAVHVAFPQNHLPRPAGEEPTPGSAAATASAARESPGAVVAPGAGANFPGERTTIIPRLSVLFDRSPGRHRHEPDRPGAPGLPPRPIDYPRPQGAAQAGR